MTNKSKAKGSEKEKQKKKQKANRLKEKSRKRRENCSGETRTHAGRQVILEKTVYLRNEEWVAVNGTRRGIGRDEISR